MSKKGDGSGGKLLTTVATAGGVFVLRKLLAHAVRTGYRNDNPVSEIDGAIDGIHHPPIFRAYVSRVSLFPQQRHL